jgi:hypothetical protein
MGIPFSFGFLTVAAAYDFVAPSKEIQWLVSVFAGITVSLIVRMEKYMCFLFVCIIVSLIFGVSVCSHLFVLICSIICVLFIGNLLE